MCRDRAKDEISFQGSDDIKLFIKDEPHKLGKLEEGRERLISCLSLEDQMVDRILFWPWQEVERRHVMEVTSKTGWSPLPEGYKILRQVFPVESSIAIDKKAWDWTMPSWVVWVYICVKMLQMKDPTSRYQRCVWARLHYVLGPCTVLRMPNGDLLQQGSWGFMKSGWLLTLSMNSMAQIAQHILAWWREFGNMEVAPCWAMGDDLLVKWNPDEVELKRYLSELGQTGCLVKYGLRKREFCGFEFTDTTVNPLYVEKHCFRLRHLEPKLEAEVLLAYSMLYALAQERWIVKYANRVNIIQYMVVAWAKGLPATFKVKPSVDI